MNKDIKNEILEWIKTIFTSLVLACAITLIVQPTIVNGDSMYPTLENKDYLLVNKLAYEFESPKRGDIIVFKTDLIDDKTSSKKDLVKRIIALPGEHIIITNNEVYINNKKLDEPYIKGMFTEGNVDLIVPKNQIFAMGDNRPNSLDSRFANVGTISFDNIVGKISIHIYPFDKFKIVH